MSNYLFSMRNIPGGWYFIVNYGMTQARRYKIYNSKDCYYAVVASNGRLVGIVSNLVNAQYIAIMDK